MIPKPRSFCASRRSALRWKDRERLLQLRRSMRNTGKSAERSPAEDMAIRLNHAAAALDKALLELVVEPWHIDQPLRPALGVVQL